MLVSPLEFSSESCFLYSQMYSVLPEKQPCVDRVKSFAQSRFKHPTFPLLLYTGLRQESSSLDRYAAIQETHEHFGETKRRLVSPGCQHAHLTYWRWPHTCWRKNVSALGSATWWNSACGTAYLHRVSLLRIWKYNPDQKRKWVQMQKNRPKCFQRHLLHFFSVEASFLYYYYRKNICAEFVSIFIHQL